LGGLQSIAVFLEQFFDTVPAVNADETPFFCHVSVNAILILLAAA